MEGVGREGVKTQQPASGVAGTASAAWCTAVVFAGDTADTIAVRRATRGDDHGTGDAGTQRTGCAARANAERYDSDSHLASFRDG